MKSNKLVLLAATSAVALSCVLTGCDRTVSQTESTKTSSDGSVTTKEKTTTESPDGTVKKTEDVKKTPPTNP